MCKSMGWGIFNSSFIFASINRLPTRLRVVTSVLHLLPPLLARRACILGVWDVRRTCNLAELVAPPVVAMCA